MIDTHQHHAINENHAQLREMLARSRLIVPEPMQWGQYHTLDEAAGAMLDNLVTLHGFAYQDVHFFDEYQQNPELYGRPGNFHFQHGTGHDEELIGIFRQFADQVYDVHTGSYRFFADRKEALADIMSHFYSELAGFEERTSGPFHYGNGLSTRILLMNVAQQCGCNINYNRIADNEMEQLVQAEKVTPELLKVNMFTPSLDKQRDEELKERITREVEVPESWRPAKDKRLIADPQFDNAAKAAYFAGSNSVLLEFSKDTGEVVSFPIRGDDAQEIARQVLIVRKDDKLKLFDEKGTVKDTVKANQDYIAMMDGGLLPAHIFFDKIHQLTLQETLRNEKGALLLDNITFPQEQIRYDVLGIAHQDNVYGIPVGDAVPVLNINADLFLGLQMTDPYTGEKAGERHELREFIEKHGMTRMYQIPEHIDMLREKAGEDTRERYLLERANTRISQIMPYIDAEVQHRLAQVEPLSEGSATYYVATAGGGGAGKSMHESVIHGAENPKNWIFISRDADRGIFHQTFTVQNALGHEGDWLDIVTPIDVMQAKVVENAGNVHVYNDGSMAGGLWQKYARKFEQAKENPNAVTAVLCTTCQVEEAMERAYHRKETTGRALPPVLVKSMHNLWNRNFIELIGNSMNDIDHLYLVNNSGKKGSDYLLAHTMDVDNKELQHLRELRRQDPSGENLRAYLEEKAAARPEFLQPADYKPVSVQKPEGGKGVGGDFLILQEKGEQTRVLAVHDTKAFAEFVGKGLKNIAARTGEEVDYSTRHHTLGRSIRQPQATDALGAFGVPYRIMEQLSRITSEQDIQRGIGG